MCAAAHTTPRPLRGVQSLEKGGRSASATIALEADTARHSPRLPKKTQRVASKAQQKRGALSFSGLGRAGRGETLFLFAQTRDSKKLENIRENAILRNLESTESSVEILKNEKTQNLGSTESKVDSKTITESSCIDSKTYAESKGILRSEQRQNLTIKESAESRFSDSKGKFKLQAGENLPSNIAPKK